MFQCVLKFGFLFFFLFSLPTFADNLAVSHTPESCVKYLVQNRLVEELKYIDMSWIPEKADYKNLILSLSIPESLIDKSFLSSWLQSGELWNFVAVGGHGILYNGHGWIKMSWAYVLNGGGL